MLFGSCHLILFVSLANFQIVRRQCCQSVDNNSIWRKITRKYLSIKKSEFEGNSLNFQNCATAQEKGKSPDVLHVAPFLGRVVGACITRQPFCSMCFQDQLTVEGNQRSGGSNGFDGLVPEPWWLTCRASSSSRLQRKWRICSTP